MNFVIRAALARSLAAAAFTCLLPTVASASLVLVGPGEETGSGLGTVNTVLSFRPSGNGTHGCGQITFGDVTSACEGTDVTFAGGANNQTYTFAELGLTNATALRLFLNINEPDDAVTLNSLSALFYTASGMLYHTATYMGPTVFTEIGEGIGGQGLLFRLDDEQAGLVQAQLAANNVLGLRASVSNASGGFETFNVGLASTATPPHHGPDHGPDHVPEHVPEPATMALFGLGLLGSGLARRRR